MMTAEALRDIRTMILRELYRVQPRGRNARNLHALIKVEVDCDTAHVEAQLAFLAGENYVHKLGPHKLSPGLDPFWAITSAGMKFAEVEHLI